ncbi:glycoside hydrolase family 2 TIM barrel-domain containing protein [uncultured Robinsoniella sp.]|uniref:glycoside hydrolase family 2 protein n=1 Tax=uncultured Robinsoniella sp. TaxID=904190 RepID=UPI00374E8537
MIRQKFNDNWSFFKGAANPMMAALKGQNAEAEVITLPHDAMIHEKKCEDAAGKIQTGFYPGGTYTYLKKWRVPGEAENQTITLEFEGVYGDARIFINGDYAGKNHNGYAGFQVKLDSFLKYGEENEIKVDVNNTMQPNSRWYSGSGIYRNVNIMYGDLLHIDADGVKVSVPEISEGAAVVMVDIQLTNEHTKNKLVHIVTELLDPSGAKVAEDTMKATLFRGEGIKTRQRMFVRDAKLWSTESPELYECRINVYDGDNILDQENIKFGIRSLQLDADHGLRINGAVTKLRGACIHHDNGVIGACTLERAEERRCEQLKAAGFNCIRSAHHPLSRAMLDACDRIGILVIDELGDMWNHSKNTSDYSMFFMENWEKDAREMVHKDYNHPSVIMYCMGNEVQEVGTPRGAALNRKISNMIKTLDDTRYTTNSINGLFAAGSRMREIMGDIMLKMPGGAEMMQKKQQAGEEGQKKEGGSNQMNSMMSIMRGPLADAFAAHPIMTEIIEEFASSMDVAGFNYLTGRHAMEHELHPNRVVMGIETYPDDIVKLWDIVEKNPHVLGDMTWTGYDYLGEAGIGIFYYDGRRGFEQNWPSTLAYIGDINLIGYRRPISYLREIVYGLRKEPYIAVERVDKYGLECIRSAWMHKDNIASWTWPGYEGKPAIVNVYSDADEVELFLNGESKGKKPAGAGYEFTANFNIAYTAGRLEAVAYRNGKAEETCELTTAGEVVSLSVQADKTELCADGADLAYIKVLLQDKNGNENLFTSKEITVEIEGPATIQGFGSAAPETLNQYDNHTWETWDGQVLAVIRAGHEKGEVKVTFRAEGLETQHVTLQIK